MKWLLMFIIITSLGCSTIEVSPMEDALKRCKKGNMLEYEHHNGSYKTTCKNMIEVKF